MDYQLKEIDTVAKFILDNVTSKVLLLYGDMGAGKTTLIKSLVKALGSHDDVSSPTFSIVNEYKVLDGLVYHFDLYRLKDIEEAYNFGIEEYLYSNQWIIMEWPQLIESLLPEESNRIDLVINNHLSRSITLNHNTNFNELKSKVIPEHNT
ncbi:MAG: tRNA (adenosine(37)-N6)-threonylcarbamoyltransferase complex ATPase subunit type 1 TsaE [Flavobacteriales bacterium]|nr:tRNA (adenosine(37)-N6)-threonylcarbamoyltransferase complex ATPase subunit type 1 TsaE [Flavobacteriales bacterium]